MWGKQQGLAEQVRHRMALIEKTKQKHVYANFSPHYTKLRDQYQYYIKCRGRCVLTNLTSVYCD